MTIRTTSKPVSMPPSVTAPTSAARSASPAVPAQPVPASSFDQTAVAPALSTALASQTLPTTGFSLGVPAPLTALSENHGFVPVKTYSASQLANATPVNFAANAGAPEVKLKAGDTFVLTYDPSRTPVKAWANGIPAYGVTAFIKFQPSGELIEQPALGFEESASHIDGQPRAAPVLAKIPAGTTEVEVWFKQFSAGDEPAHTEYDSGWDHQNYHLPVGQ